MSEKRFRIMGGPSLPWGMVAPYADQARDNHDQSLERLNERGGLSPQEYWAIVNGERWREVDISEAEALTWMQLMLKEYEQRSFADERAVLELEIAKLKTEVKTYREYQKYEYSKREALEEELAQCRQQHETRDRFEKVSEQLSSLHVMTIDAVAKERDAARKLVRKFQEASMLGDHQDNPHDVTPEHLRQLLQDLGDDLHKIQKERDVLDKECDEWNDLSDRLVELLGKGATWPPERIKCGWCIQAAGDDQNAYDATPSVTLEEVRAHALVCPANPTRRESE